MYLCETELVEPPPHSCLSFPSKAERELQGGQEGWRHLGRVGGCSLDARIVG